MMKSSRSLSIIITIVQNKLNNQRNCVENNKADQEANSTFNAKHTVANKIVNSSGNPKKNKCLTVIFDAESKVNYSKSSTLRSAYVVCPSTFIVIYNATNLMRKQPG